MSEWISVKDRLPDVSHDEIVCWNGKFSRIGKFLSSLKYGDSFFSPHDEYLRWITHWMPLLPPPKD